MQRTRLVPMHVPEALMQASLGKCCVSYLTHVEERWLLRIVPHVADLAKRKPKGLLRG